MSFQTLFTFLSALVWPIVHLLLSLLAVLVGLLLCIFMVVWLFLRARPPGPVGERRRLDGEENKQ